MSQKYFNKLFFDNRYYISDKLSEIFDNSLYTPYFALLKSFFNKGIDIDRGLTKNKIRQIFNFSSFYIVDYDASFTGGYSHKIIRDILSEKKYINTDEDNKMWNNFIKELKLISITNSSQKINLLLNDFNLFEDRLPKNVREVAFSKLNRKYNFFNLKTSVLFYEELISFFFSDFNKNKKLSKKGSIKYEKSLCKDYVIMLDFDENELKSELKNFYLILPKINIEIRSVYFNEFVPSNAYLVCQEDYPIYRIGWNLFLGNTGYFRIGDASDSNDTLIRETFFYFEQQSFFIKKYISIIENILNDVPTSSSSAV